MKLVNIEQLRNSSRKLVRELGMLQLDPSDSSMTPGHWHALIEIDKDPGLTISKLASLLLMSISKMSRLIKSLERHGWIELRTGVDKREKYLHITSPGKNEVTKIDQFSKSKIEGAFEFLKEADMLNIIEAINKYSSALEKSRLLKKQIKIARISTSRLIRRQIISMISDIQKNEFSIAITAETNVGILKAEQEYYYMNSYNFWYAVDDNGKIIGSIGLKKIDAETGEVKKFFVVSEFRGKGIAQKLMSTLVNAAIKHGFKSLYLGTVDKLHAAQKFYEKHGFKRIEREALPKNFEICPFDSVFFRAHVKDMLVKLSQYVNN